MVPRHKHLELTVEHTFDPADVYLFDENDETVKSKRLDGAAVSTTGTDSDATTRSVS